MGEGENLSILLECGRCLSSWQMENFPMFVLCAGQSSCSLLCRLFSLYQASASHPDRRGDLSVTFGPGRGLSLPGPEVQRPG